MNGRMMRRLPLLALVVAAPLAACFEDERVVAPDDRPEAALFRRYVAMGNSITAGFMSGGINDSTQNLAYPVLLAARANAEFGVPELARPGCPPPLTATLDTLEGGQIVLNTARVGGGSASTCALREYPAPELLQNVAVPGATIRDAVLPPENAPNPSTLTTLLIGGESQLRAMQAARPTLVTAWLGNNDVLGPALSGEPAGMTPLDTFADYAQRLAGGIGIAGADMAVLIGVVRPTNTPVLQPGLYYWVLDSLGMSPKPVMDNCAPTIDGATNNVSLNLVSFLALRSEAIDSVSCAGDAPFVLDRITEVDQVNNHVGSMNSTLGQLARDRNWIFLDPNVVLGNATTGAGGHDRLRRCVGLDPGDSLDEIVATAASRCPWPSAPNFWGSLISYDGVHPSPEAHELIANAIAAVLNSELNLSL